MTRVLAAGDEFVAPHPVRRGPAGRTRRAVTSTSPTSRRAGRTEPFGPVGPEGARVEEASGTEDDLVAALDGARVCLTQMAPFTARVFDAAPRSRDGRGVPRRPGQRRPRRGRPGRRGRRPGARAQRGGRGRVRGGHGARRAAPHPDGRPRAARRDLARRPLRLRRGGPRARRHHGGARRVRRHRPDRRPGAPRVRRDRPRRRPLHRRGDGRAPTASGSSGSTSCCAPRRSSACTRGSPTRPAA